MEQQRTETSMDSEQEHKSSYNQSLDLDWKRIGYLLFLSRAMDRIEREEFVPSKTIFSQFASLGHDFAQILIGTMLNNRNDMACGYYRSRAFALGAGMDPLEVLAAPHTKAGGPSDGRDVGHLLNSPSSSRSEPGCSILAPPGGVGAQYTPIVGCAQSIAYRRDVLKEPNLERAIAVALGGDASLSSNGFWSALNIVTADNLPFLFFVEDNGYGISVPAEHQTPGGNHSVNLSGWPNLKIMIGDGCSPSSTPVLIKNAVDYVRNGNGPCMLRLKVPRLAGHSMQDDQMYKGQQLLEEEKQRDPLVKLRRYLTENEIISEMEWLHLKDQADNEVTAAARQIEKLPNPDVANVRKYVFAEYDANGKYEAPLMGGLSDDTLTSLKSSPEPQPEGARLNMVAAIRQTLDYELSVNPKMLIFGEDVGPKGGVHTATLGLTEKYGAERVFDSSLSEEGIIGRSQGMAINGLLPVPEIQFRKYAEPAAEQISDIGILRWRTANRYGAPMVVRIPVGFAASGDIWHAMSNEVEWVHRTGWQVAMPSNAEDAVGMLRYALRDPNPTMFLEHRRLYDAASARSVYPGNEYVLPFGKAAKLTTGSAVTVVTWGAMVDLCTRAAQELDAGIEVLDLRTLMPWDSTAVFESVEKTGKCLIVHEDNITAGFGAEVSARIVEELFWKLDAPIKRIASADVPSLPHSLDLMKAVLPSEERVTAAMKELLEV